MLRHAIISAVVVGALAGLTGCALPVPGQSPAERRMLWQAELERLFHADRRVEFVSPEGSAVVTYSRAGEQNIEWAGGTDSGTFEIRRDQFCSRWKTLRNGAESCTRVFRVNEAEYELVGDDGVYAATMILW
jgi:hypothetical protein